MYKLFHRLFGWDYVGFKFGYNTTVRRVQTAPNGEPYVICCGKFIRLNEPRHFFALTHGAQKAIDYAKANP